MTVTIHRDFGQRSDDWYAARRGMVTASTIGQLVTVGAPGADAYDCPACTALIGTPCVSYATGSRSRPLTRPALRSPREWPARCHQCSPSRTAT